MILIATIWHTGTHSLMAEMGLTDDVRNQEWAQHHCSPCTLDKVKSGEYEVHTTYRNPYQVAISWINRDKHGTTKRGHHSFNTWFEQWDIWREVCEVAKIHDVDQFSYKNNSFEDKKGLYQALEQGDWETYFRHVPSEWIKHANNLTREVHGVQFGEPYS